MGENWGLAVRVWMVYWEWFMNYCGFVTKRRFGMRGSVVIGPVNAISVCKLNKI